MTVSKKTLWIFSTISFICILGIIIPLLFRSAELKRSAVPLICRSSLWGELNPLESLLTLYLEIKTTENSSSVTSHTLFNIPMNTFTTGPLEGVTEEECR